MLASRFWAKVQKTDDCWLWTACVDRGYGLFGIWDGQRSVTVRAHRYALELSLGRKLVTGMEACHRCDVRNCVRPDHLFEGTQRDNMRDMHAKGRGQVGERHHAAKLTADAVRAIYRIYAAGGITQSALAARFNISHIQVHAIVTGKQWRSVTGGVSL